MNILIISPCLRTHGGIRLLVDMATLLKNRGHHVVFHSIDPSTEEEEQWANLQVYYTKGNDLYLLGYDVIIIGTPPLAGILKDYPVKKFMFLQMAEEMFMPDNLDWFYSCNSGYYSGVPIITYSHWLMHRLRSMGVNSQMHYIDPGVDERFVNKGKERGYVLVANWNAQNSVKDIDILGPRVAGFLKKKYGVKIVGYGAERPKVYSDVCDEYVVNAGVEDLVELYNGALFTIQATRFDCRSLVGMESISCGTPVCRGIISGDEDVKHLINSVRCNYNIDEMIFWADKMYSNREFLEGLRKNCREIRWDIEIIEKIISI